MPHDYRKPHSCPECSVNPLIREVGKQKLSCSTARSTVPSSQQTHRLPDKVLPQRGWRGRVTGRFTFRFCHGDHANAFFSGAQAFEILVTAKTTSDLQFLPASAHRAGLRASPKLWIWPAAQSLFY